MLCLIWNGLYLHASDFDYNSKGRIAWSDTGLRQFFNTGTDMASVQIYSIIVKRLHGFIYAIVTGNDDKLMYRCADAGMCGWEYYLK